MNTGGSMKKGIMVALSVALLTAGTAGAEGLYFKETTTSTGMAQGNLVDGVRFVYLQGEKSRVMSKLSEEAAAGQAEAKKELVGMAADSGFMSALNERKRQADIQDAKGNAEQKKAQEASGFGMSGGADKASRKAKALEAREADESSNDLAKKARTRAEGIDTSGKDELLASKRVVITRLDEEKIYDINAKDLTYTESSLSVEKKRREKKATRMEFKGDMSIAVVPTGETQKIAGHDCKAYLVSATMKGTNSPIFSGTYWIAEDLAEAGREYNAYQEKFMDEVGADPDNMLLRILYSNLDWAKEFRKKVSGLKGLALKTELKMTPPDIGGMGGGAYQEQIAAAMKNMPGFGGFGGKNAMASSPFGDPMSAVMEITEVKIGNIEGKQFEIADGLKKK